MKQFFISYWWLVWGVIGAILYIRHNIKSNGGVFKLRKNVETYSDETIIKRMKIVSIGLVLILVALAIVKLST